MYPTVTIAELRLQYELENALKPASLLAHLFGEGDPIDRLTPIQILDEAIIEDAREAYVRRLRK